MPQFENVSSKALLAIALAVVIPLASYLVVKRYADDTSFIPPRYHYDTVITKVQNGIQVTDTIWHSVKNITLTFRIQDPGCLFEGTLKNNSSSRGLIREGRQI